MREGLKWLLTAVLVVLAVALLTWLAAHLLLAGLVLLLAHFAVHADFQSAFVVFIFIVTLASALAAVKAIIIR